MKLNKTNIVSRDEAKAKFPDYVTYVEGEYFGKAADAVLEAFGKLKRGQAVLTYCDGKYIKAKVTSINHNSIQAIDGPVVRVSDGNTSWRVDGNRYAVPL
jgi:hypothetical protein